MKQYSLDLLTKYETRFPLKPPTSSLTDLSRLKCITGLFVSFLKLKLYNDIFGAFWVVLTIFILSLFLWKKNAYSQCFYHVHQLQRQNWFKLTLGLAVPLLKAGLIAYLIVWSIGPLSPDHGRKSFIFFMLSALLFYYFIIF